MYAYKKDNGAASIKYWITYILNDTGLFASLRYALLSREYLN